MEITHILVFNLALFAAIISPGPAFLIAVQSTLASGRKAGIATGIGLALVAAMWTMASLLGLDAIFTLFPWAYAVVKTVGAIYLLYVAYQMWRCADERSRLNVRPASHAFRQGLMVNVLNPKTVLFAAAVLAVIFPANMTLAENGLIILNHFLFEVVFYTLLALGMSQPAVSKGYLAAKSYIDRVSAAVLSLLGIRLLFSR